MSNTDITLSIARDLKDLQTALYGTQALARVRGLDPVHEFDRTAVAALIEREAGRANAIVNALAKHEALR